jgi:hypothetical protein
MSMTKLKIFPFTQESLVEEMVDLMTSGSILSLTIAFYSNGNGWAYEAFDHDEIEKANEFVTEWNKENPKNNSFVATFTYNEKKSIDEYKAEIAEQIRSDLKQ